MLVGSYSLHLEFGLPSLQPGFALLAVIEQELLQVVPALVVDLLADPLVELQLRAFGNPFDV